jgi:hypothetical protein
MVNVFPKDSVKALFIGWDNYGDHYSDDPAVTEKLQCDEEGEPLFTGPEVIAAVLEACRRGGFEYIDDMNIVENGLIEESGPILLADWIEFSRQIYTN